MTSVPTHALLWSQGQCALHVEPIVDMLSENRKAYTDNRSMDYVPIYFGSDDECHKAAEAAHRTMRERQTNHDQNELCNGCR